MSETVLVDKTYPGLRLTGEHYYVLDGDLVSVSGLAIVIPLCVTGKIEAGEWIKAGEWIEAGWGIKAGEGINAGWGIKAGGGIKAGWGINAGKWINAGGEINAGWGINAGKWIEAGGEINAGGGIKGSVKQVFGVNTSYYVPLQLHWPVYLFADKMKIGCQLHDIETWQRFTDEAITGMDSHALDFWNTHKEMLFSIHDKMSKQTKQENGKCPKI